MLLLRLYTDLSVCSAIVGASFAGAPCPGALVANLSKSQLSQVDFKQEEIQLFYRFYLHSRSAIQFIEGQLEEETPRRAKNGWISEHSRGNANSNGP